MTRPEHALSAAAPPARPHPLRICLSPGGIGGGGIGMVMLHLAEALLARGHAVDLLHLDEDTDRAPPPGCTKVRIGAQARGALPGAVRYLRRARPDLVISARDYINVMMLGARGLARLGVGAPRLVWSFHTHRASELAHGAGRGDRIADWMARQVLTGRTPWRPDALVAVSRRVALGLSEDMGLRATAFTVIENPVWTPARLETRQAPCPHPWLRARAALAHSQTRAHAPDGPVILAVGRLTAQKDFATLIRALERWPGPQAPRLIILGKGSQHGALRAQIAAAGLEDRVDMPGHVVDVLPYMARADLFVMPSRWEGFPLALVEALGCGCPVVATDCPGGSADMLARGRLGALVPPAAPDALAQAMAATLAAPGDPAPRLAAALRYNAERAAERYLALARPVAPARTAHRAG